MSSPRRRRRVAIFGTILAVLLFSSFLALPFASGTVARFVPHQVEAMVGAQMVETLADKSQFCRESDAMIELDALVDRLSASAGEDHRFHVYVADERVLNAFAAPGGHIVLYRGILEEAEGPDEVAGVLAHEMAHVIADHPTRGMVEAVGYGVVGLLIPGEQLSLGSQLAETLLTSHYSREDELEADRLAVDLLNRAGLDSRGLNDFFDRLEARGGSLPGAVEFLSTHPAGNTRKAALRDRVRAGDSAMTAEGWTTLRRACELRGEPEFVGSER